MAFETAKPIELDSSSLITIPADEGESTLTGADLMTIPPFAVESDPVEKELDPVPNPGPGTIIAQADGRSDREYIDLKVEGDSISKKNTAIQALMNIPQDKEQAIKVINKILDINTSKTYGESASILIQKDPTPVKRKELATNIDAGVNDNIAGDNGTYSIICSNITISGFNFNTPNIAVAGLILDVPALDGYAPNVILPYHV